jgi:hypothetical protein
MLEIYPVDVPVDVVAARDLRVGDIVRMDDPQAHRVERVVAIEESVVLEMRPIGLDVPDAVRVRLSASAVVDRLGTASD